MDVLCSTHHQPLSFPCSRYRANQDRSGEGEGTVHHVSFLRGEASAARVSRAVGSFHQDHKDVLSNALGLGQKDAKKTKRCASGYRFVSDRKPRSKQSRSYREEWGIIDDLLDVLCHLNEASQELSRQKVATVGLISPIFAGILNKCVNIEADNNTRRSRPIHPAVMRFKEYLASDLCDRWITLQVGSSPELLISAYRDPRTKDFAFVEEEERQECLERATSKVLRLATNVILEPRAQHTNRSGVDEDSDSDIESPAAQKRKSDERKNDPDLREASRDCIATSRISAGS